MVNERCGSNHKLALLRNLNNKVLTFTAEKGNSYSTWRAAGYPAKMARPPSGSPVTAEAEELPVTDDSGQEVIP